VGGYVPRKSSPRIGLSGFFSVLLDSFRDEYWPRRVPMNHFRTARARCSASGAVEICSSSWGCSA